MNAETRALRDLWKKAFGDTDTFLDLFFDLAYSPQRCCFLQEGNDLAAALYWFDCFCGEKKIAYIYAVATDPALRGRGFCRRLMEQTHRLLQQQGYAGAVLVPGDADLFTMYGKMGYRTMSRMDSFSCAAGKALPLKKLSPEEYAAARRRLLPPGSILQEGVSLNFFAGFGEFYTGRGFLLAAVRDGDQLLAAELLGDVSAAPGITAALGCTRGQFRAPGTSQPFAMYKPLAADFMPRYFGLAFD